MKVREAAALYIADKQMKRRANTVEGYVSALKRHVLPRWGDIELEDIDSADIQEWIDSFDLPGAAEKAWKTLRQVVRWSIRSMRLRIWDPTSVGVELPRRKTPEPRTLTAKEVSDFLRGLWGAPDEAAAILSVSLGLRPGETRGLKWSDIDLRTGAVSVSRTRVAAFGRLHVYEPKTAKSRRVVYLPKFALRRLRQLKKARNDGEFIVGDDAAAAGIGRRLKSWCRKNGLPWVSLQNLRHTWATLAIEAGVGIESVALLLGHTEIGTAYSHYMRRTKAICEEAQGLWQRYVILCS